MKKEYRTNKTDSTILTSRQITELIKVCEFEKETKLELIYRGSRDGFGADVFHAKCDRKLKTLTIVKSTNGNIFGGFTSVDWTPVVGGYKNDPNAFLFSLVNQDNQPIKLKYNGNGNAIYCASFCSATFGGGHDLHIATNANANEKSFSKLGIRYTLPLNANSESFLACSRNFQITEIEVFHSI